MGAGPMKTPEELIERRSDAAASAGTSEIPLILARFRLLAHRRAAWLQRLWREEGEPGGRLAVTHAEAEWMRSDPELREWNKEIDLIEAAIAREPGSRLNVLSGVFGISACDSDLLQACLAVALDPSLSRVCAYLQDNAARPYVTEEFAARLYGHGRCGVWGAESPLFRYELVTAREGAAGEPRSLACDPQIRDWVLGRLGLDESLINFAKFQEARQPLPSWPIEETAGFLWQALQGKRDGGIQVRVLGTRGSGRRTFAAALCARLGLRLLVVDADAIDDALWRSVHLRAHRQAYLGACALAWTGDSLSKRPWPRGITPFPVQFILAEPGQDLPSADGATERTVVLPTPDAGEREALWLEHLPAAKTWPAELFRDLVQLHRFNPGEIASAGRAGAEDPAQAARFARE